MNSNPPGSISEHNCYPVERKSTAETRMQEGDGGKREKKKRVRVYGRRIHGNGRKGRAGR